MHHRLHHARALTRREFLTNSGKLGLGAIALRGLMNSGFAAGDPAGPLAPKLPPLRER